MADETPAPDYTFAADQDVDRSALVPIYTAILGHTKAKPTVSLGAVTRDVAEAWLRRQHEKYWMALGRRSQILRNMDLVEKVELVGLTDG